MKRHTTLLAAGSLVAAIMLAASPAAAAVTLYSFSGTFQNGWSLSGSFTYDDAIAPTSTLSRVSDVAYSIGGQALTADRLAGDFYNSSDDASVISFQNAGAATIDGTAVSSYKLNLFIDGIRTPGDALAGLDAGAQSLQSLTNFGYRANGMAARTVYLTSGTISATPVVAANVGAVPEPATWALMLAGFGLTSAALRRRRPRTTVAFA